MMRSVRVFAFLCVCRQPPPSASLSLFLLNMRKSIPSKAIRAPIQKEKEREQKIHITPIAPNTSHLSEFQQAERSYRRPRLEFAIVLSSFSLSTRPQHHRRLRAPGKSFLKTQIQIESPTPSPIPSYFPHPAWPTLPLPFKRINALR